MTEDNVVKLFKCLSDKSRLQILKSLINEDMYVELLTPRLNLAPSTISFHLKSLGCRCGGIKKGAVLQHIQY